MGGLRLVGPGNVRCVASFPFPRQHQCHTARVYVPDLHFVVTCAVFVVVACAAAQEDLWPNLVAAVGPVPAFAHFLVLPLVAQTPVRRAALHLPALPTMRALAATSASSWQLLPSSLVLKQTEGDVFGG